MNVKAPPQQAAIVAILKRATGHITAGRLDEAEKALQADGKIALKTPVGWNVLGDIHLKAGRAREALKAFDRAIKMAPGFPEAHCNRGVALQDLGRLREALRAEDKALRLRAGYTTAHFNRGNILRDLERHKDALAAYDAAIAGRANFAEALQNRAYTYLDLDQPAMAMADFRAALTHNPRSVASMLGRASALRQMGSGGDALVSVEQALEIEPDHIDALMLKHQLLSDGQAYDDALAALDHLLALHPDTARAHVARARTLSQMSRFDDALAAADRAIELEPRLADAHVTRSLVLGEVGRFDEQVAAIARAEKLGASGGALLFSRAMVYVEQGDYEAAIAANRETIDLEPNAFEAHQNLAMAYFSTGLLAEAWPEHEWRLLSPHHPAIEHGRAASKWQGEDLTGKRLLVYCEQGHGDTIQFLRFLDPLRESGADITFIAPKPLITLFSRNYPWLTIAERAGLGVTYDFQIPLMSLPSVFATTWETLPRDVPYLRPAPEYADKWRERIGDEGFRVGIIWQGNPKYGPDIHRSIPLTNYAPLAAVEGVRLISLQVFHGLDQLDDLPSGMEVERLGEEITNNPSGYREVTGAMANLDLIVTSDTGPAHLAGAMALPVWVALRNRPDWRWMNEGTESPWYPTMRLFRQKERGAWLPVFEEIADALRARMAGAGNPV